ncbi:DUF1769-domain-containing protein [Polychaeton citri CBS 116435]|uniref:DUF1769-domain-containing protein n=1 Tax=Polychaeton citri CBS 116435 TaxID=1314669 RepID=A0A9P4QFL6_9PEZI|nr:DUF1769-domain-containing protein [Polychaeton citri CBS 116435]
MADKYILSVTAGPNYTDQKEIPINTADSTHITSDLATVNLSVRIQNYRGLPQGAPNTSPYFSKHPHQKDLYSIAFTITPKRDINGHDLVFGNDFDHPIRNKLPPGFQQAFNMVKWYIDPGLYGDLLADEPHLYGPLLSSMNVLRVGPKDDKEQEKVEEARANAEGGVHILEEGGDGDGKDARESVGLPADAAGRKKFFLTEANLSKFTFEKDREYSNDFFNPYLDFNDFALRLPGFSIIPGITIPIISYWDGQPLRSHSLRYVCKDRSTEKTLFVIIFTLLPKEEQEKNGRGDGKKEGDNSDDLD